MVRVKEPNEKCLIETLEKQLADTEVEKRNLLKVIRDTRALIDNSMDPEWGARLELEQYQDEMEILKKERRQMADDLRTLKENQPAAPGSAEVWIQVPGYTGDAIRVEIFSDGSFCASTDENSPMISANGIQYTFYLCFPGLTDDIANPLLCDGGGALPVNWIHAKVTGCARRVVHQGSTEWNVVEGAIRRGLQDRAEAGKQEPAKCPIEFQIQIPAFGDGQVIVAFPATPMDVVTVRTPEGGSILFCGDMVRFHVDLRRLPGAKGYQVTRVQGLEFWCNPTDRWTPVLERTLWCTRMLENLEKSITDMVDRARSAGLDPVRLQERIAQTEKDLEGLRADLARCFS